MAQRVLVFRTMLVDDLLLEAGKEIAAGSEFRMFTNYDHLHDDKIVTISEAQMLKHVFMSDGRQLLFEELGIRAESPTFFDVMRPVVESGQKPGDIDALICCDGRPDLSIGIQCKRVKVEALNQHEDKCNKIHSITEGIKQANLQRRNFGFHQNYLAVLIETFGRERLDNNTAFRGPTKDTFEEIYNIAQDESLDQEVGIIFIKVTQPTGKSWTRNYQLSVCVDKRASRLDQRVALTGKIKELLKFSTHGAGSECS
jgi:hypothetical protein